MTAHNCLYIFTACLQQLLNFDNSNFWVYTTTSSNISHSNKNRVILINCANGIDIDLLTVLLHRKPHKHHFSQEKFQFQPLNQQPTTGDKCSFGVLGRLRVMGYTDLIAPKYPLVGDRLMSYQFYNLPTTKINISLHILEDTSWKFWYRKQHWTEMIITWNPKICPFKTLKINFNLPMVWFNYMTFFPVIKAKGTTYFHYI